MWDLNEKDCAWLRSAASTDYQLRRIVSGDFFLAVACAFCLRHCPVRTLLPDAHQSLASVDAAIASSPTVLASKNFARPRPFSFQQFLTELPRPAANMSDVEKKARLSGESPRVSEPSTTLPTVNVVSEKPEPPKAALHSAFYVM